MMTRTAIHPLKIVAAVAAALLVWGLVLAYASSPAWAADITVNSLASDADGNDGECTLKEAITSANTNTTSGAATNECAAGSNSADDNITFALPGSGPWTLDLTEPLPLLASNMAIVGPGADQLTVRRSDTVVGDFRIFQNETAAGTAVVTISGMTISNGTAGVGGGIYNNGTLTVSDSTISGNSAGYGSGIGNRGTLTVSDSTISNNSADFEGGGIYSEGTDPTLTVSGSTISNNSAGATSGAFGGGVSNYGTMTVSDSTISGNTAAGGSSAGASGGRGGGIYNETFAENDDLTITDSTISGNTATAGEPLAGEAAGWGGEGGGIYNDGDLEFEDCDPASASTSATITNSTISGNTAADGEDAAGGGMLNYDGLAVIENSTITHNTAPDGTGSGLASYGDCWTPTTVLSSIITRNQGTDVDFVFDTTNSFTSNGYNLIGSGNAAKDDDPNTTTVESNAFDQAGDQTGVTDPKLGALADNGGPTKTHALLAGSPAVDKGNTDLTADQRGQPRPFDDPNVAPATEGDNSDIGAFEAQEVLNAAPDAQGDAYSTQQGTTLTVAAPGVLSNDTDVDNDPLTALKVSDPSHGSVTLNPNGSFTYTPNANYIGPDSFTYKANDGRSDSGVATVSISVTAANKAPIVRVAPGGSCTSDTHISGTINLALSDPDTPAQELTLSATSSNQAVVPNANIGFGGGTDASRNMNVTALKSGTPTLTVTVSDGDLQDSVLVKVRVGTNSNDTLSGLSGDQAGSDMILARNGSDTARGWGYNDLLCGGNGNDSLRGDLGNDTLVGGPNNDKLTGDLGADRFLGGSGTDTATDFSASQGDTRVGIP